MDLEERAILCQILPEDLPTDGDFLPSLKVRDGRVILEVFLFAEVRKGRIRPYSLWFPINGLN